MRRALLLLPILLIATNLLSQELSTGSNRAARFFSAGIQQYDLLNYEEALEYFQRAISADRNFFEAYLLTGDVHFDMKNYRDAVNYFRKAVAIDPGIFPMVWFNMGNALMATGDYHEARDSYINLADYPEIPEMYLIIAEKKIENCEFAIKAIENPVPFDPVDLGLSINSDNDEYWPTLTADEQTLIFTRQTKRNPSGRKIPGNLREDFFVSYHLGDGWSVAADIGPPLNSELNEGAPSVTADGRFIFFTGCNREGGLGSCDIYFAERQGKRWGEPVNLGSPVNTSSWEAQPSVAADGKALYFASNRKGGSGKMDLWFSRSMGDGIWGEPVNLGEIINTDGNEMSPFIHPDNQTLYFSSDGHTGMGGYDIFVTRKNVNSEWSEPENLGYPLNTHFDEMGLIVNAQGDRGYFSSDRMTGVVRDIYSFELHDSARPLEVSYMKGTVFDAISGKRLNAGFDLIDLLTAETVIESRSDPVNGEFLVPITTGKDYALNVSLSGYLFYSDHFSLSGFAHQTDPYLKDIPLHPIREGEKTVLRNIFFEFDSFELKPESLVELGRLVEFMNSNPGLRIRINGHTDNMGQPEYNITLSERRSGAVAAHLESSGIVKDRIEYAGFGETMPVAANDTEEGRAENRRTEFEVIGVFTD